MSKHDSVAAVSSELVQALQSALGSERVLTGPEAIARYPGFAWFPPRPRSPLRYPLGNPAAIVRPDSTEDVATVLREATAKGVPVVPYGAGTGVMGGALPIRHGIVLDLGAMNRIRAIEPGNRLARVESGVILGELARAAEQQGLLFAHDPWSLPIATVGGAVSTNGVGYLAAGYGGMGAQVRGLEVVLATGEIVSWSGAAKRAAGPDLWPMFVGAEGTLGVVTNVVVQLFPWPEARALAGVEFPTFADGFRAIDRFVGVGLHPTMIDYEEEEEGEPLAAPAQMFLAFDGPPEVVAATSKLALRICGEHQGTDLGVAAAAHFWEHRHDSALRFLNRSATLPPRRRSRLGSRYLDVAVPIDRVLDYCLAVIRLARAHGISAHSFGIWGRPELLSVILEGPDAAPTKSGELSPLDKATDAILRLAREEGGSIEYCHGVGVRFAHLLPEELGAGYALYRRIKSNLDPTGILNPGKLSAGE